MLLAFLKTFLGLLQPKNKAHAHSTSQSYSLPGRVLSFGVLPLLFFQTQCALLNEIASSLLTFSFMSMLLALPEIVLFPDSHDKLLFRFISQLKCLFLAEFFCGYPRSVFSQNLVYSSAHHILFTIVCSHLPLILL